MATTLTAPMVGKILNTLKSVGDTVEEDDVVVVMEALKMEIPVVAPAAGRITAIRVSVGQAVDADEVLAEIE